MFGNYTEIPGPATSDLTLSCLEILTSVVWTFDTFENNFGINHIFTKKWESSVLDFDQGFSFKYFLEIAFVREIPEHSQTVLGPTGMNRLTLSIVPLVTHRWQCSNLKGLASWYHSLVLVTKLQAYIAKLHSKI